MNLEAFPFGFQCQCGEGFAGARGEINVNECSSSPCLNGYCYDSEFTMPLLQLLNGTSTEKETEN